MAYGLTISLPAIIVFIVKALFIVLTVALIIGLMEGVRRTFFEEESSKWLKVMQEDPNLKVTMKVAFISVILLIAALVFRGLSIAIPVDGNAIYLVASLIGVTIRVFSATILLSLAFGLALCLKKKYLVSTNRID